LDDLLFKRCEVCGNGHYVIPPGERSEKPWEDYRGNMMKAFLFGEGKRLVCDACGQDVPRLRFTTEEERLLEDEGLRDRISVGI